MVKAKNHQDSLKNQTIEYKNKIIRHYNSTLSFDSGNGNFVDYQTVINETEPGFRIKSEEVNGNLYFTSSDGIKKLSANPKTDFNSIEPVNAGVPKAIDISAKVISSSTGFLPPRSKVGYKLLYGYKDNNNVLILGSPTSLFTVTNFSNKVNNPELLEITFSTSFSGSQYLTDLTNNTGKYFLLSTKVLDFFVWYSLSDLPEGDPLVQEPSNSETFGKTPIQVSIATTDTNETIAAKTANTLQLELNEYFEVTLLQNVITLVSKEDGNIKDSEVGNLSTLINIDIKSQGNLQSGDAANCQIEASIPQTIDKNKLPYFIQIYRTEVITESEELNISDINTGEECNLVYEAPVTQDPGSVFVYLDDLSEDFRSRNTPLYNNPYSGEGISQTNELPPIAKDIESFNNYTFYSNTKIT